MGNHSTVKTNIVRGQFGFTITVNRIWAASTWGWPKLGRFHFPRYKNAHFLFALFDSLRLFSCPFFHRRETKFNRSFFSLLWSDQYTHTQSVYVNSTTTGLRRYDMFPITETNTHQILAIPYGYSTRGLKSEYSDLSIWDQYWHNEIPEQN